MYYLLNIPLLLLLGTWCHHANSWTHRKLPPAALQWLKMLSALPSFIYLWRAHLHQKHLVLRRPQHLSFYHFPLQRESAVKDPQLLIWEWKETPQSLITTPSFHLPEYTDSVRNITSCSELLLLYWDRLHGNKVMWEVCKLYSTRHKTWGHWYLSVNKL